MKFRKSPSIPVPVFLVIDKPLEQAEDICLFPAQEYPFGKTLEELLEMGRKREIQLMFLPQTCCENVLKRMTAMEAEYWALDRCQKEHLPLTKTNILAVLNNLDMEYAYM